MEANSDYFLDGHPEVDGIEIFFFNDETAAVEA